MLQWQPLFHQNKYRIIHDFDPAQSNDHLYVPFYQLFSFCKYANFFNSIKQEPLKVLISLLSRKNGSG
jgi:hypothetical protein